MKHYSRVLAGLFLVVPLGLVGCGGGGSNGPSASRSTGGTAAALTGDVAAQAAIVSSYQAFQGGVNYPFAQVQATLPSGSAFKAALRAALQKRAAAHGLTAHTGATADGIGLYSATSTSGAGATLNFYTDAAETQSAGSLTITQTAPATTSLTLGTYTSYPVDFAIAANVTSGPLPCTGSGTIALTDSAGAGEIKGNITLPATNVTAHADLTLDDSGTIGGTVTVNEKAQTLTLTGLSGGLAGAITGNVTVAPGGDTGTAALDIAAGTFAVTLHTPMGTATGTSNASGGLDITLPSGASETISSPLTASPDAPVTNTTPGTGTGPSSSLPLDVPIGLPFVGAFTPDENVALNNVGQVLLNDSIDGHPLSLYPSATATATSVNTSSVSGAGNLNPVALNSQGEFVAYTISNNNNDFSSSSSYFWASPSASPIMLAAPSGYTAVVATALSNTGRIVGFDSPTQSSGSFEALTWASAVSAPTVLLPLGNPLAATTFTQSGYTFVVNGNELSVSGVTNATTLMLSITQNGNPVLDSPFTSTVTSGNATFYTFLGAGTYQATVTPSLNGQSGTNTTFTLTISDSQDYATGVNDSGLIVGRSLPSYAPVYWNSGSTTAHTLPLPSPSPIFAFSLGINNAGQIYGNVQTPSHTSLAYFWSSRTAQPVILPVLPGTTDVQVNSINSAGTLAGYCGNSMQGYQAVIWKQVQGQFQITNLNTFATVTEGNPPGTFLFGNGFAGLNYVTSINDNGVVAGPSEASPGTGGGFAFVMRLQ